MHYRKIWEKQNGEIPKDEEGRSYEIHHIDGDSSNNSLDNLKCVSIEEHYRIHIRQGDWFAAHMISKRLKLTKEERAFLSGKISESNIKRFTGKKKGSPSEETKQKISKSLKGRKVSEESLAKRKKGISKSEEWRRKRSLSNWEPPNHRGKVRSEETKQKMREAALKREAAKRSLKNKE